MTITTLKQQIEDLLPQTQCELCGYKGCEPYAAAIAAQSATINRCLPGGVPTLTALGQLLNIDPQPFVAEMAQKTQPFARAIIREEECIGCTKCLQACPVDAIVGAARQMHTVVAAECTGCELCVAPCPVDCIEMQPVFEQVVITKPQAQHFRKRWLARQARLAQKKIQQQAKKNQPLDRTQIVSKRKSAIAAAVARVKAKKQGNLSNFEISADKLFPPFKG